MIDPVPSPILVVTVLCSVCVNVVKGDQCKINDIYHFKNKDTLYCLKPLGK